MYIRSLFIIFFLVMLLGMSYRPIIEGMKGCRKGRGKRIGKVGRRRRFRDRYNDGIITQYDWRRREYKNTYGDIPYYWGGWYTMAPPYINNYYPYWLYTPRCRSGCGYLGNGIVGCVNPTNTPYSCIFASDCYGC